jgi:hypothetical protein
LGFPPQLSHLVYLDELAIRLHSLHVRVFARGYPLTRYASTASIARGRLLTVKRLCQGDCELALADAARPRHYEALLEAALSDRAPEERFDPVIADQFRKRHNMILTVSGRLW